MRSWTKRDYFTYLVLFVLLFVRFPIADFVLFLEQLFKPFAFSANLDNLRWLQNQSLQFAHDYSFILVMVVIIVNRNRLKDLNIDKFFIPILLIGGMSYRWASSGLWLVVINLWIFFIAFLYVKGWLKFGDTEPILLRITLVIVIAFFLCILFIIDSINFTKIGWAIYWFKEGISLLIVEEVMFRGLLWMFLKNLNFSVFKIVVLQAILFWLSHVYYANDYPILFWVLAPIAGIIFGIVVWRTRSITSSTIAHVLFNIWWWLFLVQKI